jgi:hypothetical protein
MTVVHRGDFWTVREGVEIVYEITMPDNLGWPRAHHRIGLATVDPQGGIQGVAEFDQALIRADLAGVSLTRQRQQPMRIGRGWRGSRFHSISVNSVPTREPAATAIATKVRNSVRSNRGLAGRIGAYCVRHLAHQPQGINGSSGRRGAEARASLDRLGLPLMTANSAWRPV